MLILGLSVVLCGVGAAGFSLAQRWSAPPTADLGVVKIMISIRKWLMSLVAIPVE